MKFYVAGHALIENDAKYLVTHRSRLNEYMPLKWDIPGGIVLPNETLEEAIYREVFEETKLSIEVVHVIHAYSNRDQVPKRQTFQIVYLCKYLSGEVQLNPSEHDKYQWLNYSDIRNIETIDFLSDLVKSYNPT